MSDTWKYCESVPDYNAAARARGGGSGSSHPQPSAGITADDTDPRAAEVLERVQGLQSLDVHVLIAQLVGAVQAQSQQIAEQPKQIEAQSRHAVQQDKPIEVHSKQNEEQSRHVMQQNERIEAQSQRTAQLGVPGTHACARPFIFPNDTDADPSHFHHNERLKKKATCRFLSGSFWPANAMWRNLLHSGFETCFGPSSQGAGTKMHLKSGFCAILTKRGAILEFEIDGPVSISLPAHQYFARLHQFEQHAHHLYGRTHLGG